MTRMIADDGVRYVTNAQGRTVIELTPYAQSLLEERNRKLGLRKSHVKLPGGRLGYVWDRDPDHGRYDVQPEPAPTPADPVGESQQPQEPSPDEQAWPWPDEVLCGRAEQPPRIEDALGEDFEF